MEWVMLLGRCDCHCRVDTSSSSIPPSESSIPPSDSASVSTSGSYSDSLSSSVSQSSLSISLLPPNACCAVLAKKYRLTVSGMPTPSYPSNPAYRLCYDFNGAWEMNYGPATYHDEPPFASLDTTLEEWHSSATVVIGPDPPGPAVNCLHPDNTEVHVWNLYLRRLTSGVDAGKCYWTASSAAYNYTSGSTTSSKSFYLTASADLVLPNSNCLYPPTMQNAWGGSAVPGGGAPPATAYGVLAPI